MVSYTHPYYLYLIASSGLSEAARFAGKTPVKNPTIPAKLKINIKNQVGK